jgi:putative membrane protein
MWGNGFNFQGWGGMWGLPVAAGIVLLVIWAVRAFGNKASRDGSAGDTGILPTRAPQSAARQTLDERYAKGELTTEQYQERLNVLGETKP